MNDPAKIIVDKIEDICDLIVQKDNFYISGHVGPDGDSIGACFGLGLALEKMGKKVQVMLETIHPRFDIIPGRHLLKAKLGDGEEASITDDYVQNSDRFEQNALKADAGNGDRFEQSALEADAGSGDRFEQSALEADAGVSARFDLRSKPTLICVDCADITRLPKECRKLVEKLEYTINIDHHFTNTNFAKYNLVDGQASSTCEMIYRLIESFAECGYELWDEKIASAIYAGMVSDTGGFRFNATSQDTLKAVGKLINMNIPFTEIYTEMVHMRSYTELKLLSRVLENTQQAKDGRIIYCCVSQEMMKNFKDAPDATSQDLEGVVELLLNVRGAEISFLVYDRNEGEAKVSLRSREFNVAEIAKKFGGGGHQLAAGATVKKKIDVFELGWQVLSLL